MKQSTETKKSIARTVIALVILVIAILGMFTYSVIQQAGTL